MYCEGELALARQLLGNGSDYHRLSETCSPVASRAGGRNRKRMLGPMSESECVHMFDV